MLILDTGYWIDTLGTEQDIFQIKFLCLLYAYIIVPFHDPESVQMFTLEKIHGHKEIYGY